MLYSFMHPHTFTILFSVAMLVHLGTLQKSFLDTWCSRGRTWNQMKNLSLPTIFSLYRLTVFVIPFKTILRTSIVWYSASLGRSILINCTWSLYGKHRAHAGFAQLSTLIQCIYLISHVIELLRQCLQVHTFVKSFIVFSVKLMVRILLRWTSWPQTAIPENVVHWLFAVAVYIEKWDHYRPHHCKFTCSNHMDTYTHENLRITNFGTNAFIELAYIDRLLFIHLTSLYLPYRRSHDCDIWSSMKDCKQMTYRPLYTVLGRYVCTHASSLRISANAGLSILCSSV